MSEETATDQKCWVGFDLGGTKMLAKVYDPDFRELGKKKQKTLGYEGMKAGLERMSKTIRSALEKAELTPDRIAGIGVGCPGPLDLEKGMIREAPNLGWEKVPLKDHLEKEFKCPVVIANDVDTGIYGENIFGAATSSRCVIGVFPGTGIGGGCVYEGEIIRGKNISCMEIGHVNVIPDGPRCGCGLRGCLEAVASRLAIASAAAQAAYRGQAPWLKKTIGTDLSNIRSSQIAEAIKQGDKVIEEIVTEACGYIGQVLGGVIHLFCPDTVVLGGGLVEAIPDLMVSSVRKATRQHLIGSYREMFTVVPAQLGDDATVKGAAAWARHQIRHSHA